MKRRRQHPQGSLGHRIDQALIRTLGPAQIGPYGPSGHPEPTGAELCEHCGEPESAHVVIHDGTRPGYTQCPAPRDDLA